MKGNTKAVTPEGYLASIPEPRQSEVRALDAALRKALPRLRPVIVHGMLGYGPCHYRTRGGTEGESAVLCLASQKGHMSLYSCAVEQDGRLLTEVFAGRLGKTSCGKSCVRFKKLADLDLPAAIEFAREAARLSRSQPGISLH